MVISLSTLLGHAEEEEEEDAEPEMADPRRPGPERCCRR